MKNRVATVLVFLFLALLGTAGWLYLRHTSPAVDNTTPPQWVWRASPNAKVVLVFVHGVFGDTLGTWAGDGKTFFDFVEQHQMVGPQVDVFAFGFTSNYLRAGSLDLREAGNSMYQSLQFHRVLDYPTIVFVAHSMGGLVVLRSLASHPRLVEKVPLIVLYASPQEGSQVSLIADKVANNPALAQMVPADGNSSLQQLDDDWRRLSGRPFVTCAYEKAPMHGILVVPWSSASRFCDRAAEAIGGSDHSTIVKPDSGAHPSVQLLINELENHVLGAQLEAKLETPDFVRENGELVFNLSGPIGKTNARLRNAGGRKMEVTFAEASDPRLHLWPDTPKGILPRETILLQAALGYGANAREYRFKLRTNVPEEHIITVKVPDAKTTQAARLNVSKEIAHQLNRRFSSRELAGQLAVLPANDPRPEREMVAVVKEVIAKESPGLPAYAHWVLAADVLAAQNWPVLSAVALRQAEQIYPAVAKMAATQHLAGMVSAQSGIRAIFATTETPNVKPPAGSDSNLFANLVKAQEATSAKSLAQVLVGIPALKSYGFSLEGDLQSALGNRKEAVKAYLNASEFQATPSITQRMMDAEQGGGGTRPSLYKYESIRKDSAYGGKEPQHRLPDPQVIVPGKAIEKSRR